MEIREGQIRASFLYDVAESIELQRLPALLKTETGRAHLQPKPYTPAYVQFSPPPVTLSVEERALDDFRVGYKFYDYGVVSVTLWKPFAGTWEQLLAQGANLQGNTDLEAFSEQACRKILARFPEACLKLRPDFLDEDYLIFAVHEFDRKVTAGELLERHGGEIASLLRGEAGPLHQEEVREVLGTRISYLNNDLIIPTWNTAFVYDTPRGAEAAFELMEFANSQLLEFRYYDALLDRELDRVYTEVQQRRSNWPWQGWRYSGMAQQVQSLLIDVKSLADKTENTLKVVGDVYAARLLRLLESRLGLDAWKASVNDELATLDRIYRFLSDQVNISRSMTLEGIIVAVLLVELWMILVGLLKL